MDGVSRYLLSGSQRFHRWFPAPRRVPIAGRTDRVAPGMFAGHHLGSVRRLAETVAVRVIEQIARSFGSWSWQSWAALGCAALGLPAAVLGIIVELRWSGLAGHRREGFSWSDAEQLPSGHFWCWYVQDCGWEWVVLLPTLTLDVVL